MEIRSSDEGEVRLHNSDVLDKDVYDRNGLKLGHVTLAREVPAEGLVSFDVLLRPRAGRVMGVDKPVLTVSSEHVVATDFDVSLDEDAPHLAFREHVTPLEYEED